MTFLRSMLSLGQLYTDNTNTNDNDNDADGDDDNTSNTQQTSHDCIGSLACMPNEPKTNLPHANFHLLLSTFEVAGYKQ